MALAYRADANNQCYPSISCLIRDTGMGRRTIQEHLLELLAQDFINITKRIGSSNLYTLIYKCEDETEADNPELFSQHSSETTRKELPSVDIISTRDPIGQSLPSTSQRVSSILMRPIPLSIACTK